MKIRKQKRLVGTQTDHCVCTCSRAFYELHTYCTVQQISIRCASNYNFNYRLNILNLMVL